MSRLVFKVSEDMAEVEMDVESIEVVVAMENLIYIIIRPSNGMKLSWSVSIGSKIFVRKKIPRRP